MALSLSYTIIPLNNKPAVARSETICFLAPLSRRKLQVGRPISTIDSTPRANIPRVTAKIAESLSSMINELERRQAKDRKDMISEDAPIDESLPQNWRRVHGQTNWEGMLDPLDPLLRKEILRYGDLVQVTYDSFDNDDYSKYCGSNRYHRWDLFKALGMHIHGYNVTRYLYASSNIKIPKYFQKSKWPKVWSQNANWIGYVSVSDDKTSKKLGRRDINIMWRGTVTKLEWLEDFKSYQVMLMGSKIPCKDPLIKVEAGFLDLYTDKEPSCPFSKFSAREQILAELHRLREKYDGEQLSITICGHSLGAALAVLSGYDIAETGAHVKEGGETIPICVFSFCGPRVGNLKFKERVDELGVKVLRLVNEHDVVPKSPGFILNENLPDPLIKAFWWLPEFYMHVGEKLQLDSNNSPFLRKLDDIGNFHNLEALLHLVDGYTSKGAKFELQTGRDPALVNKSCDYLHYDLYIPPNWWQLAYKGLARENGRWTQVERLPVTHDHPDDMHDRLKQVGIPVEE